MTMPKPVRRSPFSRLVIFKIFIRIYMFWPPTAAFTTTTPLWYAHRPILVILPTARREDLFRQEVFKILKAEGKITDVIIENMMNWPPARRALSLRLGERHSGFNVYCGRAIWPHNEDGLENLARGTCPP